MVDRENWKGHAPGSYGNQDNTDSEGRYSSDNLRGYALYSELDPDKSLADIYNTIVIHHEGNWQTYSVLAVQEKQMQNGYYDIAYHFAIGLDGTIYIGRDLGVRGAHVEGANSGAIGILFLGDFHPGWYIDSLDLNIPFDLNHDDQPTQRQIQRGIWLIRYLDHELGIDSVFGHNELNNTVCPGANLIRYIPQFNEWIGQ